MTKPLIQMGEKVLGNKLRPCCSFELLRVQYFTSYILQFKKEKDQFGNQWLYAEIRSMQEND